MIGYKCWCCCFYLSNFWLNVEMDQQLRVRQTAFTAQLDKTSWRSHTSSLTILLVWFFYSLISFYFISVASVQICSLRFESNQIRWTSLLLSLFFRKKSKDEKFGAKLKSLRRSSCERSIVSKRDLFQKNYEKDFTSLLLFLFFSTNKRNCHNCCLD